MLKQKFHVYECEPCLVTFAVEDHEDVDHSEVKCPFCSDDEIRDVGYGEMEVDYETRKAIDQEAENCIKKDQS